MYHVNRYWFEHLWTRIGGGADMDNHPAADLDVDQEDAVRHLVAAFVRPALAIFTATEQARIKESFRYALNTRTDWELGRHLDSCLPPFEAPKDPWVFYERVWNLLYTDSYEIPDLSVYVCDDRWAIDVWDADREW
jgi:hypothetical protein